MSDDSSPIFRRARPQVPGSAPGIHLDELKAMPSGPGKVVVTCMDYDALHCQTTVVGEMDEFLNHHRPEWVKVRWINVAGVTDMGVIHALAAKYQLHPLAIEDMLQGGCRSKVETYPGDESHHARTFIVARKIHMADGTLHCEQIFFFVGEHTLLTFQESHQGVWDPVRERVCKEGSRLRGRDLGYLVYALLDAIVDHCFPVLEHYSDLLQDLEIEVLDHHEPALIKRIHHAKREMMLLRREFRPMREVIHQLQHGDHANLTADTAVFMRDLYDHSLQVIEMLETYRDIASSLTETYMNANSQRMNSIMKVLTVIATIFMPLSFIAGVFGMNFARMPELQAGWAYPFGFWGICAGVAVGMVWMFRWKRWL
ncbi:magnesium/cobalt transporter CorA [Phragmitibacter flavus]|uniref:Magnesium transport protein CorA n=1 Tax=Phragmitibacter flavus TaxID=2576071 RepID=A0A5R8KCV1_9BACT|nr:magnesium/cobalt transporter CorA [Phragmitibacter flavus]TLD70067.1 magnesium/cobalt transporter CorA [Phragmitibacter flavus]